MVGIRSGRLSEKDVFRGVLWTGEQENAKRTEIEKQLKEEGWTVPHLIFFETEKRLMLYKQSQPGWKERQEIWNRIYPTKRVRSPVIFTDAELSYIEEKLWGVNEGIGVDILEKISKYLK